jgi:sirohydrochlorin cobaltochelatase
MSKHIRKGLLLVVVAAAIITIGCQTNQGAAMKKNVDGEKGILVVSFGTSYPETRKLTIEATEKRIAEAFPDYEVRRAFTSHIIIKILKERGLMIDKPEEALAKMYEEGFSEVIVQPLHLMPGEEFHEKILKNVAPYEDAFEKIAVGRPLLSYTEDYHNVVDALDSQIPSLGSGEAVVFMGHGTHHPANAAYAMLQRVFDDHGSGIYVGTVEGYPILDDVIPLLERDRIRKVTLMPLMLVAGDHASNDMAGDEEDSWKMILLDKGYEVDIYLHGMGENPAIQDLYVRNVKDAMAGEEKEGGHH